MPTLGTGLSDPMGPEVNAEDIYIEGGPNIWFQDAEANPANNPDSDGFYWGLSGTAVYPVYEIGCYDDLSISDSRTSNPVTCAALGNVRQMQRRDALEISLTLKSFFPLAVLRHLIGGGAVTENAGEETEKMGLGELPQNQLYQVWMSREYDEEAGDRVALHFHNVQWTEATPLTMAYAREWTFGLRGMALADTGKPAAQRFATIIRYDPSAIP